MWLYHRFTLSLRDIEDLMAERNVIVSYESIRQWCATFGLDYARRLRKRRGRYTIYFGSGVICYGQQTIGSCVVVRSSRGKR